MSFITRFFALALCVVSPLPAHSQPQPFYPDDPYFYAGSIGHDYYGQWHLVNQMPVQPGINAGLDVNILGAWQMGFTGKGVIIGIVDDGVEGSHPDLNFHNAYSWGFGESRADNLASAYRGSPSGADDNHGTAVAGVAGAIGGNGIGVTGAAPLAGIAAIQDPTLGGHASVHAMAILYQGQFGADGLPDPSASNDWSHVPVRVKNHSYGFPNAYWMHEGMQKVINAQLESLSHGVIHVLAAGNSRQAVSDGTWDNTMDSTKAYAANTPGVIVVAALGSDGIYAWYSNFGSNVFVTAPSNGAGYGISTTDRVGRDGYNLDGAGEDRFFKENAPADGLNYSSSFGGTSSAAPLVSGIMALGVEANPDINARTAQHILARTSRIVDAGDTSAVGGWVVNGGGYAYNRNYGFGLIDATAFVAEAVRGGYATEQTFYQSGPQDVGLAFADAGNTLSLRHEVKVELGLLQPVEFISVHFFVTGLQTDINAYGTGTGDGVGTILGDLEAWLTSPTGTRQMLFTSDSMIPVDHVGSRSHIWDTLDWSFLSYAYWGEMPEGDWILELVNKTGNNLTGLWEGFSVTIGMGDYVIPEPAAFAALLAIVLAVLAIAHRQRTHTGR